MNRNWKPVRSRVWAKDNARSPSAIYKDFERPRHLDMSFHPLHQFGFRCRFRPSSQPNIHSCDAHDNDRGRKNGNSRPRKAGRNTIPELSNTSESLRHGRLPRPEFKSRRLKPCSTAVHHQEHYEPVYRHYHLCDGPLQLGNHLDQLHLSDHQVPLSEQSSSHLRVSREYGIGTSDNQNSIPHRLLSIFSEQAIENNSLHGAVMQVRERLHERFRAASLVSDRHSSTASTVMGVENYLAPDERTSLTDAENWDTIRSLLSPRNDQSEEVLQMGVPSARGPKTPALSKMAIANLQRELFVPRSTTRDQEFGDKIFLSEQEDCPICLEHFLCGEELIDLPCIHRFHPDCLTPWLVICGECPYCRANVLQNWPAHVEEIEQLGN